MSEEEILKRVRDLCGEQFKYIFENYDILPHPMIQTYLLLQILEKLTSIDDTLTTIGDDSWNDHHNRP